jgi:DNA repair protein RadA/Sms
LGGATGVQALAEIRPREEPRQPTGVEEFDRVLGGGLVAGGVVLIGGDPGIGKSTLLLQALARLAQAAQERCCTFPARNPASRSRCARSACSCRRRHAAAGRDQPGAHPRHPGRGAPRGGGDRFDPDRLVRGLQSAPGSVAQVRECAGSS